jgi:Cu(I)/Ag(I) efflux system membrane fusion protein
MKKIWIVVGVLVLVGGGIVVLRRSGPASSSTSDAGVRYQCPMHPNVVSDRPGACPICHMDLVPMETTPSSSTPAAEGRVPVAFPAEKEQWIGVRLATVEKRPLVRRVRASARVAYDPELYTALADYREALRAQEARGAGSPDARAQAESLLSAARLRLARQGFSTERLSADAAGDEDLLTGARPWIYVEVYEDEAALVKAGQTVELTSPAFPGRTLRGRVDGVDSVLNAETRTLRVRARLAAGSPALRPESYLEAAILVDMGERTVVSKESIIDTGLRRLVYRRTSPGHYAPRTVVTGRESDEDVEILDGLAPGDVVAASGNFLIDSESRLKAVAGEASHAGH